MPDIFVPNENRVLRVVCSNEVAPAHIRIRSSKDGYLDAAGEAIITGVTLDQSTQHQFAQSLTNVTYLYTFGDQIANITVTGMAFPEVCDSGTVGLDWALDFYARNKVSAAVGTSVPVVEITIGSRVLTGFLVASSIQLSDASTRIGMFTLNLRAVN